MEQALNLIIAEREKQINKHGRTVAHDVEFNKDRQLAYGAAALLTCDQEDDDVEKMLTHFPPSWDKDICRNMLVNTWKDRVKKSAAIMLAELERIIEIEKGFSNPVLSKDNIEEWKTEFNTKMKLWYDLYNYIPEMIGDDWQTDLYEGQSVDDAIKAEADHWN